MINTAKELNKSLKESNEAKEYFALKKAIENDTYINQLLKTIKDTQLEAKSLLESNNMKEYVIKQKELELLKDTFYNNPLVVNYLNAKNDMQSLLEQVISIIGDN